jgi:hypothetical protein
MTDPMSKPIPLQDELPAIIESLRNPAGDDSRFSTLEAIAANRTVFTEAYQRFGMITLIGSWGMHSEFPYIRWITVTQEV